MNLAVPPPRVAVDSAEDDQYKGVRQGLLGERPKDRLPEHQRPSRDR